MCEFMRAAATPSGSSRVRFGLLHEVGRDELPRICIPAGEVCIPLGPKVCSENRRRSMMLEGACIPSHTLAGSQSRRRVRPTALVGALRVEKVCERMQGISKYLSINDLSLHTLGVEGMQKVCRGMQIIELSAVHVRVCSCSPRLCSPRPGRSDILR